MPHVFTVLFTGPVPNVVTWLGTLLGGVGLYLTFRQARLARMAAAQSSVTVRRLERLVGLSRLNGTVAQLDALHSILDAGQHAAALTLVPALRRSMVTVVGVAEQHGGNSGVREVAARNIQVIDYQLRLAIAGSAKYRHTTAARALAGLDELVAGVDMKVIASEADDGDARY